MTNNVAIVIPAADVAELSTPLLAGLLESIIKFDIQKEMPIILCFDGCHDMFIETFVTKYPFIVPIINSGNRSNFCGNANRGLRYVHKELKSSVIIVNQDTVLSNQFTKIYGEGLVSPIQVKLQENPPFTAWEEYLAMGPEELIWTDHLKVTGFCLFVNKQVMDKCGYLDEFFKASFEDDDLCIRAKLAGFPVQTINIPIHHFVSKAGSNYQAKLSLNLDMFRNKFSVPHSVAHADCGEYILNNHIWIEEMHCG
jgi:GT2 family glycosyltransferase